MAECAGCAGGGAGWGAKDRHAPAPLRSGQLHSRAAWTQVIFQTPPGESALPLKTSVRVNFVNGDSLKPCQFPFHKFDAWYHP